MPQPTQFDVHVDAMLTNISVAFIQDQARFIATRVFPVIPVDKQTNKYFVYTKNDWFRDEAELRADTSESTGSGYTLTTASYSCDVYAFHKDIGDQTRANTDNPLNPDREATEFVSQRLLLRQEIQWVSEFFATGVWATDKVGGTDFTQWNDYSGSEPIEDIETAKEAILAVTGYLPNTLVLGYQVYRKLKNHPDIIERIKYTSAEAPGVDLLARYFDIPRIFVSTAIKATNLEGETAAYQFTHGKHAWLGYVNPNPGLLAPSAGYIFSWSSYANSAPGAPVAIARYRMDLKKADRIEGEAAWDNKVVASDLGYFFSGAVA